MAEKKGSTPYRIRSFTAQDIVPELNRILQLLSDRLDKMEGFRGQPRLYDTMLTESDIVVDSNTTGIILKDDADPPTYWRITIDSTGTINATQIVSIL